MDLRLRKVKHPQAHDNYRVVHEGVEVGSIGSSYAAVERIWTWGIDTVLPRQSFPTDGEGRDLDDCKAQFKQAWEEFSSDPGRLSDFLQTKADAANKGTTLPQRS